MMSLCCKMGHPLPQGTFWLMNSFLLFAVQCHELHHSPNHPGWGLQVSLYLCASHGSENSEKLTLVTARLN